VQFRKYIGIFHFFKVIRFRGASGHRQHDDDTAADADDEFGDDELTIID